MIPSMVAAAALVASRRSTTVLLVALAVLDLAYQSCSSWILHTGGIKHVVWQTKGNSPLQRYAPERALVQLVHLQDQTANVIFCAWDHPFAAELAGHGFVTAWYDPELMLASELADADASGTGWRALFARTGARYAITTVTKSAGLTTALADAQLLRQLESVQLWKFPPGTSAGDLNDLFHQRDLAAARFRP
jgi:hypothetical protein